MIQELQTGILDINNKYNIDFSCKQLDDIILKIIIYDKSLPADLSNYNCRLKAFKADQVPLIQNTNISIKDNFVTIKASKQLTTTQGIVKAELQFINKTTLEKKSTFYINIEVVASVLDVDGIVSTPTCTILEEIDHKLDQIENIGEVLDEAKEVRDTLTNKTIPTATIINSKLETNIGNASTKITEVESIISSASIKIEEVETCINNADSSKKELDLSKTNADISKENLDTANVQAEKNIEELKKIGDAKDLAVKVETNKSNIENLQEKVEDNTSQLKDCAKKDDLDNAINKLDKSKYNREAVAIDPASDLLTFPPGHFRVEGKISKLQNYPINRDWIHATVEISGFMNDDTHQGYKVIIFTTNNGDVYMNTQTWDADKWSGWKQLATIDDTGWITLPLIPPLVGYSDNVVPKYRKINNILEVRGAIKGLKTINSNTGLDFSTLPVGFRPKHTMGVVCQGSRLAQWYLTVSSSGVLNIDRYSEDGSTLKTEFNGLEWLPFQIMFSVD
ncbi:MULTISPECIES: viral A-type inclusion protein [unclassified Clostridium]|uniref:viral A-type inclusion protein n=1 Tax=unclassified Clostridium TaxID=2614128 RepID=UPI00207A24E8|nr:MULTISPECIES: viral A-type inclusion protein [unclassified Clostridium]